MVKIPDNPPRVRTGQIWRNRKSDILYCITGGARSRNGQRAVHTRRYDMKIRVSHAITEKDLWRFYELVGTENTLPEYVPWHEIVKNKEQQSYES